MDELRDWLVTFRRRDDLGIADFVKRVAAKDSGWAHAIVFEAMKKAHPQEYTRYTFMSAVLA